MSKERDRGNKVPINSVLYGRWRSALAGGSLAKGGDHLRSEDGRWRALGVLLDVIDAKAWYQHPKWGYWYWHEQAILAPEWLMRQLGWSWDFIWRFSSLDRQCEAFAELNEAMGSLFRSTKDCDFRYDPPLRLLKAVPKPATGTLNKLTKLPPVNPVGRKSSRRKKL